MKKTLLAAGLAVVLSVGAAAASTITFSSNNGARLTHGDFVSGRFDFGNGLTGVIRTRGGSGVAQIFNTSIPRHIATEDPDLQRPRNVANNRRSAGLGNALIVNENRHRVDDNAGGGIISFLFDSVVEFSGVTLIDLERNQPVTIRASRFNSGPLSNGDNYFSNYRPSSTVFTRSLSFHFAGSGAIDNIRVSAVPLPAPALMLLGGLGLMGAMRRRKKS